MNLFYACQSNSFLFNKDVIQYNLFFQNYSLDKIMDRVNNEKNIYYKRSVI